MDTNKINNIPIWKLKTIPKRVTWNNLRILNRRRIFDNSCKKRQERKSHKLISHFLFVENRENCHTNWGAQKNGAVIAFIDSYDKWSKVTKQLPGCPNSIGWLKKATMEISWFYIIVMMIWIKFSSLTRSFFIKGNLV